MERKRISAIIFHANWIILATVFLLNLGDLIWGDSDYWGLSFASMILMVVLVFIDYLLFRFIHWLLNFFGHKERCNFSSKESCPYSGVEDCPYDVRACFVYQEIRPTKKREYVICLLLFCSIAISVITELMKEDGTLIDFMHEKYNVLTVAKLLQPIAQSVIAAIIISIIIDIPERIKEYKNFFVDILTSYDYLKTMDEEGLTNLRKRVTRQLHIKNFPHMAEGLIDLDERFCKMLKQPYFSEYSQIVSVQGNIPNDDKLNVPTNTQDEEKIGIVSKPKVGVFADDQKKEKVVDFSEFFFKSHKTEYVAINPMHTNTPILMDIGQNSCVKFQSTEYLEEAKSIFKIKKFSIIFDDDKRAYDLTPYVSVAVSTEKMEGLIYNGIVSIRPKDIENNHEKPFSLAFFKSQETKTSGNDEIEENKKSTSSESPDSQTPEEKDTIETENLTDYVPIRKASNVGLWVTFHKKIQVKLEFDIAVPKIDVSYTKRLRYPVRLFTLDYSLNTDVEGYTVVGQMIGTLIDQPDVSTDLSLDEKRVTMRTHNWLLPKNGAVVVHCKNEDKSTKTS